LKDFTQHATSRRHDPRVRQGVDQKELAISSDWIEDEAWAAWDSSVAGRCADEEEGLRQNADRNLEIKIK
jgi:hypothetical protein